MTILNEIEPACEASRSTDDSEQRNVVDVASLRIGMRLARNIYDNENVLLLAAGMRITPDFIYRLRLRKIHWVRTDSTPSIKAGDTIREERLAAFHEAITSAASQDLSTQPLSPSQRPKLSIDAFRHRVESGLMLHSTTSIEMESVCGSLKNGEFVDGAGIGSLVDKLTDMVSLDLDLLPTIVNLQKTPNEYLYSHCVNVAALSMTIGRQLGLNRSQLLELGIGGLLQDVGMLQVPLEIRLAERPLTPEEVTEVQRHPVYTVDYLDRVGGIPQISRFVGYQSHERPDRTGYPRKRSGMFIHPYARIVAVADAFSAMTQIRPHRSPLTPYEAAKTLLYACSQNKFDSQCVRAFLDCVSLFPIGSIVQLDNGMLARVIRANPSFHTRPVVAEISTKGDETGCILDLSRFQSIQVRYAYGVDHELV